MTTFLILRYLLVLQALVGCVLATRGLHTNLRDLRALDISRQNGPKRLSTMLRIKIEAFLLAVFVAMLLIGSVFMMSGKSLSDVSQINSVILVSRLGWNIVAALLVAMQLVARKGRSSLDEYYDILHRRSTDGVSVAAQQDATRAQDHATHAQQVASSAQATATLAQEAAITASTDSTHGQATEQP